MTFLVLTFAVFAAVCQNPDFDKIKFWTGNGSKVAMIVVDFNDGSSNECFAWGYRFDGNNISAQQMIDDIAQSDTNFTTGIGGGFLSDIAYLNHSGIGGSPNYWATFTFLNSIWEMNLGLSELLSDSTIFGCSYTEWDENYNPIYLPENPIPAKKPFFFDPNIVQFWTGTGSQQALLAIDFNNNTTPECFVWGYRFDGNDITAENMINAIDSADEHFSVNIASGFLNDIVYFSNAGIGGSPNYWATFTLQNHLWDMNLGISEILTNQSIFGISYTDWDNDFNPIFEPENPMPASIHTSIDQYYNLIEATVYPNPTSDKLFIKNAPIESTISIFSMNGALILRTKTENSMINQLDIKHLIAGQYLLQINNLNSNYHQFFVKN